MRKNPLFSEKPKFETVAAEVSAARAGAAADDTFMPLSPHTKLVEATAGDVPCLVDLDTRVVLPKRKRA